MAAEVSAVVLRRSREPTIGPADAEELLADPYPTVREAAQVARRLRAAGWVVVEHVPRSPPRAGGVRVLASVYHPITYESPGDLRLRGAG